MSAAKLVIGPDLKPGRCWYEDSLDNSLIRVHYQISRVSARPGQYVLRHFTEASQEDRARAEAVVRSMDLDRGFRYWKAHDVVRRRRWSQWPVVRANSWRTPRGKLSASATWAEAVPTRRTATPTATSGGAS